MANQYKNKVVYNGTTLIDLSQDTVTNASHILKGYVGHLADGTQVTGTGEGGGSVTWETLYEGSATIVSSNPNYIAINNFTDVIGEGETWRITWNGTPYVCEGVYSSQISGCYIGNVHIVSSTYEDTGEPFWAYKRTSTQLAFSTNESAGTIALVVERQTTTSATLITKTITENGTYLASDDDADGYSSVTVNVPSGGGSGDITDGIVVKARDSNGYATAADFYGTVVQPKQFYNRTTGDGGWVNLSTINFKNGVDEIKQSGFFSCGSLTAIDLSSVKIIGDYAFQDCRALLLVTLPELTSLGSNAFITCTSLQTFVAPKLRNCNKARALRGCSALTTVQLGSIGYGVTSFSNYLFEQDAQTGLTITIYTTGSYVNTAVTSTRYGATNATIIVKASEATTYGGTSYAVGDTIVTSTP